MSSISTERKDLMKAAMADIWQMIKDFDTMEDTVEYWQALVERVGIIYNKHGKDDTVRRLCLGFLEAKEEEERAKREQSGK